MADAVSAEEELEEPPEVMTTEEPPEVMTTTDGPPEAATTEEQEKLEELPAPPCSYAWPPAVSARYERMNKLAEGMFGDVHRAWDRDTKRLVAVKRLSGRAEGGFLKTDLHDLAREAMSLGACRGHPSVVKLIATHADTRRGDGDCFLVTAYAGPINLRRYLSVRRHEGRPFAEAEVRSAMRQLLAGAKRVHKAGVLHRDMVPENVVVDQRESGKMAYRICGFALSEPAAARAAGKDDGLVALASASPYRAPEVFLGAMDYDGGVDTWALGCIMAELLAGEYRPFFGADESATAFEKVMRLAGTRGIFEWPGLQRLAGPDLVARLREKGGAAEYAGCLRQVFPEEVLSEDGYEVLSGLLETNPERRLTAKAALRKPWFRRRRFGFRGCCFAP
ncbi:unnamed protein product [Urochloa decumbens]|uniref:[RNA-polymerase]-subunit kinase n=1 Tax=Urochloa decumbens TaxID=240449 RepID=A0ABC9D020_9POAL